jgi:hypothetical protein
MTKGIKNYKNVMRGRFIQVLDMFVVICVMRINEKCV